MPPPNLYRCLIIGDTISCPATARDRSEEALRAQELPALHWCISNLPAERRGMLFSRLVLIPHLHWSPVFGSASRPAGRCGFGRLTVTPSPKSIPGCSANASALRSCSGLRCRYRGSMSGVIDIPARHKHSPHAFPCTLDDHVPLADGASVPDAFCRCPKQSAAARGTSDHPFSRTRWCIRLQWKRSPSHRRRAERMLGACEKRVRRKWRLPIPWTRPV
jgi:hypothetical protein